MTWRIKHDCLCEGSGDSNCPLEWIKHMFVGSNNIVCRMQQDCCKCLTQWSKGLACARAMGLGLGFGLCFSRGARCLCFARVWGCLGAAVRAHRWRDDRGAAERQRTQRPPLWALVVAASVPWLILLLFGECSSSFSAGLLDESSSSALLLVWAGLPSRSCTRSGRSDILHCTPLGKGVTFALGSPHPL